ncbi:minor capsid protein [Actinosynnema mirum]|uniref:Tail terminator n=1 Tax=Actinosynnema mirum (strain ATCC 29888 / DSM 43827 / JCM 3225 / NBRC 14064 / NCIMB 13271 / NRRL B-12336 / IMRU 3971 / 101) TaxID=446462 RepID=C6WBL6_ACTMD|nr:minor capsid protein [Actinosynnema mirum]ACU35584.1 hypothetical protein Amir_1635 [Actinosynnema mirum DSM 43827]
MTPAADALVVLSKALALHLAEAGLVRFPPASPGAGVPCYVEDFPVRDAPDALVLVRLEQGFPSTDLSGYDTPELRVLVRTAATAGWSAGYELAARIRRAVVGARQQTWAAGTDDEVVVLACDANDAGPVREGTDPAGRPVWAVSITINCLEATA